MEERDLVSLYLKDIRRYKILEKSEEEVLLTKAKAGDAEAKNQLIVCNLRLVVSVAKNYMSKGMNFIDLISEGNLGLIHAIDKFDLSKGYRFSTYAVWWIKQSITKAVINKGREIRIPSYKYDLFNKVNKVIMKNFVKDGNYITEEEIAKELGVKVKKVKDIMQEFQEILSLNMEVGENIYLEDTLVNSSSKNLEEKIIDKLGKERVHEILDTLEMREREILKRRYGLDGYDINTLEEIGDEFNITRERVRQLEKKTLTKLRKKYNKDLEELLYMK
ncbi:MAG: RNA polymerase sigma factor RpoD/SigA [Fusobacterium sp. JB021]|nr:RNA polymerase sigma factor RpoD/SigA [Fusobacterium sp. JB020]MDP0493586.1 RNA polymerase sigma factor RpoD/SigA [Fusobacterium sp. JB021]MDP0505951.1 RNA polymerase sigma factor RpoD/SigA [Fusobacterium sp. JB019]